MERPGLGQAAEIRPAARRGAGCATRTRHHRDTFCEWLRFALCNSLPSIWGVQRGPLVAQKLFRKAAPGTAVRASRTDTNTQTIRNGSSGTKHPSTILGTTKKSGSTSGLLWSASPEIICSSSHSGESWQLQGSRSRKRYLMFSS